MNQMIDREWDELAEAWRNQPVPDVRGIASKVRSQHRRLMLTQAFEISATITIIAMSFVVFFLSLNNWLRGFVVALAGYAILQQYLMTRSVKGLWKSDAMNVKDMLEHLARHHQQRIYRLRLRLLEAAIIAAAAIPLLWHFSSGSWDALFSDPIPRNLAILVTVGIVVNVAWSFWRIPRFRRALQKTESMKQALAGDEGEEQSNA